MRGLVTLILTLLPQVSPPTHTHPPHSPSWKKGPLQKTLRPPAGVSCSHCSNGDSLTQNCTPPRHIRLTQNCTPPRHISLASHDQIVPLAASTWSLHVTNTVTRNKYNYTYMIVTRAGESWTRGTMSRVRRNGYGNFRECSSPRFPGMFLKAKLQVPV